MSSVAAVVVEAKAVQRKDMNVGQRKQPANKRVRSDFTEGRTEGECFQLSTLSRSLAALLADTFELFVT
jgi:hypothetical protein